MLRHIPEVELGDRSDSRVALQPGDRLAVGDVSAAGREGVVSDLTDFPLTSWRCIATTLLGMQPPERKPTWWPSQEQRWLGLPWLKISCWQEVVECAVWWGSLRTQLQAEEGLCELIKCT
jgi:hypothetical protein